MHGNHKELTMNKPIMPLPLPEMFFVPLSQHIGVSASALVTKGDAVKCGQLIGSADAFVTANVHSPVSGEVVDIIKTKNLQGSVVDTVQIKNDFKDELDLSVQPPDSSEDMGMDDLREFIRAIGLVGMGGAMFPTHVKVAPPQDKKVDTLILNAAECEPYLNADYRLLLEQPGTVVRGLRLMARATGASKVIVGIEDNKKIVLGGLKAAGLEDFAKIIVLPSVYPNGAEKVLVKKAVGRKIPNKGLPIDVGVVVVNVGTAYQLAKSVQTGLPLVERVVTVSGEFANPGNYLVRVGTLYRDVVKLPKDYDSKDYRIVSGGPMMGFAVADLDVPVTKGTSGIILLKSKILKETNCIRCGRCVKACPLSLLPYQDRGLDECMECGLCAFLCPARRYLVQKIKQYKKARRK